MLPNLSERTISMAPLKILLGIDFRTCLPDEQLFHRGTIGKVSLVKTENHHG